MPIKVIVGVNWGDEGKGRMVDYFASKMDYVVRYQGGGNAGHTIINNYGTFKLHLIPSGIFYPHVINVLGPGTVINLESLWNEIEDLRTMTGIPLNENNLKISDRAILSFPFHILQDTYEEERLKDQKFGSTKRGIAPVYGDKYLKYGIQAGLIRDKDYLRGQIKRVLDLKNQIFKNIYRKPEISVDSVFSWVEEYAEKLSPYICNTIDLFDRALVAEKNVLLEAQLGSLRDVHFGIYPYTTSSCTLASFAPIGAGIFTQAPTEILGVMKAFSTCVGEGPFVTEMEESTGNIFREKTGEYGSSTGRPRRVGHFDAIASRYGSALQCADALAITKLDCLTGQEDLKICTKYRINGVETLSFPVTSDLIKAEPVYIDMDGWDEDLTEIREYNKLPQNAKKYIETIEELIERPIKYVSVGPERSSLIIR